MQSWQLVRHWPIAEGKHAVWQYRNEVAHNSIILSVGGIVFKLLSESFKLFRHLHPQLKQLHQNISSCVTYASRRVTLG